MWEEQIARLRSDTLVNYRILRRTPRSDLRWVTVVHAASVVRLDDCCYSELVEAAAVIRANWRQTMMNGGRIRRDPRGYTRWVGVIELDLLHPRMICSRMKSELLSGFGIDFASLQNEERIIVLHSHMLVDGRGHKSWGDLERDIKRQWSSGPRQVHIAQIYKTGTLLQNINELAAYSTKFKFLYSKAWLGERTSFGSRSYGADWTEYVRNAYIAIGIENLSISSVHSRAGKMGKVYSKREEFTAEKGKLNDLQLILSNTRYDEYEHKDAPREHGGIMFKGTVLKCKIIEHSNAVNMEGYTMRLKDILPYMDLDKLSAESWRDIYAALSRMDGCLASSSSLEAQYGDPLGDLEIAQAYLELEQTRADIEHSRAQAASELADVRALNQCVTSTTEGVGSLGCSSSLSRLC